MGTEADTCRTLIIPKLQAAGWEQEPHSIAEQRTFADGRICTEVLTAENAQSAEENLELHDDTTPYNTLSASTGEKDGVSRIPSQQAAFFHYYQPEAQEILKELLEKYAVDGELQFVLPDVLKLPPISQHGTVGEIASVFGGPDNLRSAVNQLHELLYAP